MDEKEEYAGHMSNYLFVIEKEGDTWKSTITFVQGKLPEEGKWKTRKVEFSSTHKDQQMSAGDVMLTFNSYLESCKGDLFSIIKGELDGETDGNEASQ